MRCPQICVRCSVTFDAEFPSRAKRVRCCSLSCRGAYSRETSELRNVERFWSQVARSDNDCWLWTGYICRTTRYGKFVFRRHGERKTMGVHRIAWTLTHGDIPAGYQVCHVCDTPPCVRPDHLFLGTHDDNVRDMVVKGRACAGELKPNHKLTESDVRQIRTLRNSGVPGVQLARRFQISQSHITGIIKRRFWAHI